MAKAAEETAEETAMAPMAPAAHEAEGVPLAVLSVDEVEHALLEEFPVVEVPVTHYFAAGLYAREIRIPAGTCLTGKIHRTQHLNVISKGRITVWGEGVPTQYIEAPFTFVAEPGTRRVGFAHEETVWTTIHATPERDLAALEAALIEPHDNPLLVSGGMPCLGSR